MYSKSISPSLFYGEAKTWIAVSAFSVGLFFLWFDAKQKIGLVIETIIITNY